MTTIPVLPCIDLDETLAFYRLLGFVVTHQQTRPNVYAALHREGAHLHFAGVKGIDPKKAFSTCLMIVPEVEELHALFADALRGAYGKIPVAGVPRISRMRKGQSRFTVVDPSGNSVIVIRRDGEAKDATKPSSKPLSRLGRALEQAILLRDFKNDDVGAAKVLDVALSKSEPCAPIERARALAARTELALAAGDRALARSLRNELSRLELTRAERAAISEELSAADRLE
ncbi:hypothetical protein AKJ09_00291 [Labilithrix luteola]|uniref:Glyoxalase/fosfomycin resistance/dioxygenase domain-containing protein n=1 Tax=Labilithrix luteola TaxID=1391654 RepID=A0A0K1PJD0_9BACT|nr:hypothetical protein AKJ09_00291 [Labilithrix luteola]